MPSEIKSRVNVPDSWNWPLVPWYQSGIIIITTLHYNLCGTQLHAVFTANFLLLSYTIWTIKKMHIDGLMAHYVNSGKWTSVFYQFLVNIYMFLKDFILIITISWLDFNFGSIRAELNIMRFLRFEWYSRVVVRLQALCLWWSGWRWWKTTRISVIDV